MAQNPPTGVVCPAGMEEACCCLVSPILLPVTAIGTCTLKVALRSRTVDLILLLAYRRRTGQLCGTDPRRWTRLQLTMIVSRLAPPKAPDPVEAARRAELGLETISAETAGMHIDEWRGLASEQQTKAKQRGSFRRAEAAQTAAGAAQAGVHIDQWSSMSREERSTQAQYSAACVALRELCKSTWDAAEEISGLLRDQPGAACVPNSKGETALHILCSNPTVTLPGLQAVLGAYPPAAATCNRFGSTPLHVLCENRKAPFAAVQLLLQTNPAAATQTNDGGVTPLETLCESRTSAAQVSAWGVGQGPATVPTPPREKTPRTPIMTAGGSSPRGVSAGGSNLPQIRTARSPPRDRTRGTSPPGSAPVAFAPRTPRSLRSQRSLHRLRTSRSRGHDDGSQAELFAVSSEGRGQTPRGSSRPLQFRATTEILRTAPAGAVRARARVPTEEPDDELLAAFREQVMPEWVGMKIDEPQKFSAKSFKGMRANMSSAPMHLKVKSIIFDTKSIILIQNSSFLIQYPSFLIQNPWFYVHSRWTRRLTSSRYSRGSRSRTRRRRRRWTRARNGSVGCGCSRRRGTWRRRWASTRRATARSPVRA